jgi:hypothetical protein
VPRGRALFRAPEAARGRPEDGGRKEEERGARGGAVRKAEGTKEAAEGNLLVWPVFFLRFCFKGFVLKVFFKRSMSANHCVSHLN